METDLTVLARRVASLERTLGPAPLGAVASLRALDKRLSALVPADMLRAHERVRALRAAVPPLGSERLARRARAAAAEGVVDDAVAHLEEMRALDDGVRGAGGRVADIAAAGGEVAQLQTVAAEAAAAGADDDERIERLLADYNAAVAGLNKRFLAMAAKVRRLEMERGVATPAVAMEKAGEGGENVPEKVSEKGEKEEGGEAEKKLIDEKKGDCSVL